MGSNVRDLDLRSLHYADRIFSDIQEHDRLAAAAKAKAGSS